MPKDSSFVDYIVEDVLGHIDGVRSRAMFGGWGIYLDAVIVGIIAEGVLYLKADKEMVGRYTVEGCEIFKYEGKKGKVISISYMNVPIEVMEDRDRMEDRFYESYELSKKTKKK